MGDKKTVLLFGPTLGNKKAFYGSGVGGYTRNMAVYLNCFDSADFKLVPCFHSTRTGKRFHSISFPVRLLKDIYVFIRSLITHKPVIVHILGQYRSATPREYMICLLSRLFNKKVVYEIKAGVFIEFYQSANFFTRYFARFILNQSKLILVEGEVYIDFIKKLYSTKPVFYFPNFVPSYEIPTKTKSKLCGQSLNVVFTGYCYEGKGVFELVEGLNLAATDGLKINITLIGKESPDFENWLNNFDKNRNLGIERMGVLEHEKVLQIMDDNDVYLYPSRHPGEGHNNSINEAMMMNMVIVSSRIGFLPSVIADTGFFLDRVDVEEIRKTIIYISLHKEEALRRANNANARIRENFSSHIQIPALDRYYHDVISPGNN